MKPQFNRASPTIPHLCRYNHQRMKPGLWAILLLLLCGGVLPLGAQISPGRLTRAHASLEGMSNCTQCHTLGQKVSNDKCLACHTEIKTRVDKNTGYHASRAVAGKDCATCHSEHHGLNFDMVRFDEANFDHQLTGYPLTGAHRRTDCRECHKPDFVDEPKLKRLPETYLGLDRACASCHEDYHQRTLTNQCAECHTTEAFAPATKFNHSSTQFPLAGKHQAVSCEACHKNETRNGKPFQVFAGVPFNSCNNCHQDPHQNNLGNDCKQCHNEQSFTSRTALNKFNHNRTNFPLRGAHQPLNCASCHNLDAPDRALFQDRLGVRTNACNTCHEDQHEGKFGLQCADCHNEKSFTQIDTKAFNHGLTDFALLGKHQAVDCRKCHVSESFTEPLPHNTCASCHKDYHEGDFVVGDVAPDCASCHTVEGFLPSTYTLEQHLNSGFPLTGAHLATPCFACHLQDDGKWRFKDIGQTCVDCHEDVHAGQISAKYYPNQRCESCHTTDAWRGTNLFDHSTTAFVLQGVHQRTECKACHIRDEVFRYGKFAGLSGNCASCHQNVHGKQFEVNGQTDCARCHGFEGWGAQHFDHSKTRFPLEGRHAIVACSACHLTTEVEGLPMVQYKIERFECKDCHK